MTPPGTPGSPAPGSESTQAVARADRLVADAVAAARARVMARSAEHVGDQRETTAAVAEAIRTGGLCPAFAVALIEDLAAGAFADGYHAGRHAAAGRATDHPRAKGGAL